jgi:LuxR family transcriptional regulator, maltose regulon positive regulatory protein
VAQALSASHRRGQDGADLTDRELSVLRLLHEGLSQCQIALELFLSFHTVHSHTKSNLHPAPGATSPREAIQRARELDVL